MPPINEDRQHYDSAEVDSSRNIPNIKPFQLTSVGFVTIFEKNKEGFTHKWSFI